MIIDKFDVVRSILPAKADSPLVVDANTVLAGAIAGQLFQAIAWRRPQVFQILGGINQPQFAQHETMELGREMPDPLPAEKPFRVTITETVNHLQ